eukprot:INCI12772.1.p1 GENE.INCI12772.1~~INCI12772.1.p1  ORF type:complete len:348 (+),score=54.40 INCI12772.1:152-1195(+)
MVSQLYFIAALLSLALLAGFAQAVRVSATAGSRRDSRLVPQRLGAEEALLVSRKHEGFEQRFSEALNNDACAPGMCAPSAELTIGAPTTWLNAEEVNFLKSQVEAQCKRSLCAPLCLHTGWDCAVKFTGSCSSNPPPSWCKAFQSQLQAEAVQIALCAQIKAFACQTVLGCCAGSDAVVGEWLTEWVRDRVYGANAPVPSLPIAACQAEVGDKKSEQAFCDQCKNSIEPVFKAVDCRWSQPTAFRPATDLDEDASPRDYAMDPFAAVGLDRAGVASKWKSMASRCKAQQKVFNSKSGDLTSAIKAERLCSCLGCCGDRSDATKSCFFPLDTFSSFEVASLVKAQSSP